MERVDDEKLKKLEEAIEKLSIDEINDLYSLLINKYGIENAMDTENYVEYRDHRK